MQMPPLPRVDEERAREVAGVVRRLGLRRDSYDDPRFYPPRSTPRELQLGYFAAMVAVDHRTTTPLTRFEGVFDGERLHGADALYRLGRRLFDEDPEFFTPERLASMGVDEGRRLFEIGGVRVWDFYTRVFLLRDLGCKTLELYGSFENLFSSDRASEIVARLRVFRAYEDPVEKKAMLLLKFLDGRGLVRVVDRDRLDVPVDNHLTRIAIRLGVVRLSSEELLVKQVEVGPEVDRAIREAVKKAWRLVARYSGVDVFTLDDYLWSFGRRACLRGSSPRCGHCPFAEVCLARARGVFLDEHRFTLTWYY